MKTERRYEIFDNKVEKKMSSNEWFTCSWIQEHEVCQDKVEAGTLKKRWNEARNAIEYRAL